MGKKELYVKTRSVDNTIQTERAYQRQTAVNENARRPNKRRINKTGHYRFWKNVGLGFKTPKEAVHGKYVDKKCPFTGDVSIRGRLLRGSVHSTKMKRTIIIRRNYLHFVNKYQRYMKKHKNFAVHCSPCFDPKVGDDVIAGQCRPLSKTVGYNVLQVVEKSGSGGKKFQKH